MYIRLNKVIVIVIAFVLLGPCNTYCNIPISPFLKRDISLFDHNIPISRCPISIQYPQYPLSVKDNGNSYNFSFIGYAAVSVFVGVVNPFEVNNIPYPNLSCPYPPFLKVISQYPNLVLQGPIVIPVLSAICARAN